MTQESLRTRPLTVAQIEQNLEEQIRDGSYPTGTQLPTVRELAGQLGVNKNTVIRAYQRLERKGYLELIRGSGTFVCEQIPGNGTEEGGWQARLEELLRQARDRGVSRDAIVCEVSRGVDHVFGQADFRIAFVECNSQDIESLSAELRATIEYPLEGILLSHFLEEAEELASQYDLIVTTFYHLGEIRQALNPSWHRRVVGVNVMLTQQSLLNIAEIHVPVLGLVCNVPATFHNLTHSIHTYHPSTAVLPALIYNESRLHMLLEKADAIVVTRSCYQDLMRLQPEAPVITVVFEIDQQSVDFLSKRVRELRETRAENVAQPELLA